MLQKSFTLFYKLSQLPMMHKNTYIVLKNMYEKNVKQENIHVGLNKNFEGMNWNSGKRSS